MINHKVRLIFYSIFACSTAIFTSASASADYACPLPAVVAKATREAIQQGTDQVIIHMEYGTLVSQLGNIEAVKAELDSGVLPYFRSAALLWGNIVGAEYDLTCSYDPPKITLVMYSNKLFIGASDYRWYGRDQGESGNYAWCYNQGMGVQDCYFIPKPSGSPN